MRWYKSAWLGAPVMFLAIAVATAAAQTSPSDPDEAHVRAIVNSLYRQFHLPTGSPRAPDPGYSPSTAALYDQYIAATDSDAIRPLNFDFYCECEEPTDDSRVQKIIVARVSPDLIDATVNYVLSRGDQPSRTRIRFQKTGSWKIHDIFWTDGTNLRGSLATVLADRSPATKPGVAVAQASVAQQPPTPAPVIPVRAVSQCGDNPRCAEVSTFVATVTDLRESTMNSNTVRLVNVTVRFRNTTGSPLFLGYVTGSAVVTDDRGNRYTIFSYAGNGVRGIGELNTAGSIDPKFALRPGESGDARFEFIWSSGKGIAGTRLVVDLTVREIESLAGNQWRLGREHALQFRGFGEGGAPAAATAAAGPTAVAPATVPVDDACAKQRPECFSAGAFLAEITRLTTSQTTPTSRAIQFSVRFRNLTGKPLVLAHTTRSTLIVDDQGNRYTPIWTNITEVRGMGPARGMESDPSFALQPGASREATFQVQLGNTAQVRLGNVYNVDFAVEEIEVFPGNQVRSARQYAVGFHDVKTNMGGWRGLRSLIDIQINKKSP